jgi:hypothetical protein
MENSSKVVMEYESHKLKSLTDTDFRKCVVVFVSSAAGICSK